jgi:peptidylamidoglycolate lyase
VGDRKNARIQVFDRNGQFLRQWRLGHPFGLVHAPDHFLYMGDAIAGRILKIDPQGRVLGSFTGVQSGQGPDDPHQIAMAPDGAISRLKF